ncbi:phospholipid/cholesterol/gamma-HCH transport system ATP-binding protein, partial [Amycolatopsis marina]
RRLGPIGMSEEKDSAQMAREQAQADAGHSDGSGDEDVRGVVPQIEPTPGMPERMGARRRKDRVMKILHTLPHAAQEGIIESLTPEEQQHYGVHPHMLVGAGSHPRQQGGPVPTQHSGQLPTEQIADVPGSGWREPGQSDSPGNGGTDGFSGSHRIRPREPGQGPS